VCSSDLAEDDLRALRAVRFAARLGFEIEATTREAITQHAGELLGISRERIGDELRAMLLHSSRTRAVSLIHELRLDGPVLTLPGNEDGDGGGGERLGSVFLGGCPEECEPMTALAAWIADRLMVTRGGSLDGLPGVLADESGDTVRTLRRALVLSNDETDALGGVLRGVGTLTDAWSGLRPALQKRAATSDWFGRAMVLVRAGWPEIADSVRTRVDELSRTPSGLSPTPLATGDDLIAAGMRPGPAFKGWLDEAYNLQLEGELTSQVAAIARIEQWASKSGTESE